MMVGFSIPLSCCSRSNRTTGMMFPKMLFWALPYESLPVTWARISKFAGPLPRACQIMRLRHLFQQLFQHILFQYLIYSQRFLATQSIVLQRFSNPVSFFTPTLSPVHFFLQKSRTVLQLLLEQLFLVCTVRTRGCLSGSLLGRE